MIVVGIGVFTFFTPPQPTRAEPFQSSKEPAAQVVYSSESWRRRRRRDVFIGRRRRRQDVLDFGYLKHVQSLKVVIPDSSSHAGVSMASRVTYEPSLYICIEVYDN